MLMHCLPRAPFEQVSAPRHATYAATQFALLPEYTAICLVLDVGKLAYPFGSRVALVTIIMVRDCQRTSRAFQIHSQSSSSPLLLLPASWAAEGCVTVFGPPLAHR